MTTWDVRLGTRWIWVSFKPARTELLTITLTLVAVLMGFSGTTYCQQVPQQTPSLLKEVIHGGSSTPWFPRSENPWLQDLTISGFLQNTSGMWVNPHGIRTNTAPFYAGSTPTNFLATEHNLMQLDINYDLDSSDHFFLRFWGVYEPQYAFNQDVRSVAAQSLNVVGNQLGCYPPGVKGVVGFTHCTASAGADYYNQLGFREAWWRLKRGPVRIFTGRQIVTWGESLAFRVADVVNPQDFSWTFGFANLEQSRIPQWMIHPIVYLPDTYWLNESFIEAIWEPPVQDVYSNWIWSGTADHRYSGAYANADSVNVDDNNGGRFDLNYQTPYGGPFGFPGPGASRAGYAAYPQSSFFSNLLPSTLALHWRFPSAQLRYSQEGFRVHTLIDQLVEATVLYWHGHQYNPATVLRPVGRGIGQDGKPILGALNFFPELNDVGFTANSPLPGRLGQTLPLVLRSEAVWQDHTPFATRAPGSNGLKYSDTMNTLLALDLDNYYVPWLTESGTLTVNLEWNNYTILSWSRWMEYSPLTFQQARHNEESFIFAASSSWEWNLIAPQWVMVYNPDGNTFLLFPSVLLTPPWTDRYFVKLQYVGVIGNNIQDDYAGGMFKGKSFILAQFQWNFNLL